MEQQTNDHSPIRLFLVDDHRMFREGLAAMVAPKPDMLVVGQSAGGTDVFADIEQAQPDVVVLDINLPGLNGLDISRELSRNMDTGILIMSMYSDENIVARALSYGVSGYLMKDCTPTQFTEGVKAAAKREIYFGPGISQSVMKRVGKMTEDDPYEKLTTRERQVLQAIAEGKTNRDIAESLGIALKTVAAHRWNLAKKMDLHDQTSIVKYAIRKGIVRLD